ncbi:MAG: mechanosensitive ion channel [Gammaproteobacteria bacterium]|nr:mechanosensitive ion channel [Gammaproteobacteria bacterium]MBU1416785.1 mechanosensitive ion channel [Gammaproteobacteria bacterium]
MSANSQFGLLLADIWSDIQAPDVIWQIGVLAVCLAVAWLFSYLIRLREVQADKAQSSGRRLGRRGFKRLAFPLSALILVLVARPLLAHWHHVNLLSLAVPLLVSLAVIRSVFFVLRVSFSGAWLATFERTFAAAAWAVVALYITGLLPDLINLLEEVSFTVGKQKLNLWLILQGIATVLATLLLALWAGGAIESRLAAAEGLDTSLRTVFARLSRAVLIVLAVLIALPMVGIDLTTLSVFGGALGVGLGFGLQKIAANYVSGFILLLDRSIRIGNLVTVGDDKGEVTRITTRYTVLKGLTGVEAIVPNEVMMSSVVKNQSFTDTKVRFSLPVQVAYGTDLERAKEILVAAAAAQPRVLADPLPKGFVVAFADSGINMEVGFWIADAHEGTLELTSDINLAIWHAFQSAGIQIPFPQREVRILGEK